MLNTLLQTQKVLILDGALATELEARGCNINDSLWSAKILAEQPELIRQVHYDYFAAGADIGISASYQATIPGFIQRGFSKEQAEQLIGNSVALLRQAAEDYWQEIGCKTGRIHPVAAASVGPYGAYLADGSEYRGDYTVSKEELYIFHKERMELLKQAGADMFACETIPALWEAEVILQIAEELQMPCWISFSCKDEMHISDGTPIAQCAKRLAEHPLVAAIGVNCTAPEYIEGLVRILRENTKKPIVVYGNSGEVYDATDKTWHDAPCGHSYSHWVPAWYEAGANIIGGCCRTGPSDIEEIFTWSKTI